MGMEWNVSVVVVVGVWLLRVMILLLMRPVRMEYDDSDDDYQYYQCVSLVDTVVPTILKATMSHAGPVRV